ncbi:carbohydrate ABC transporter permease [Dictyobacter arantiisoli]|uniref:Sugar ABC transporter permease n=1 Tax=Dictyobacter arantiisoli TaxID=2014874 RepID=A0A5A5TFF4_9CHLR|nr:sugar ABC transporter permease [Dictyobacter arantiisoli]GCF09793.1 sugar ABC transporter permease [Dictyobacter arantiisoli]
MLSTQKTSVVRAGAGERKRSLLTRLRRIRYMRIVFARLIFLLPLVVYLATFYGYPLFYSIQISLEKYDLQSEITGVTSFAGLANYMADFHDPTFKTAALHTLLFTMLSIVPQFLIGLALAVFFSRRFPLSRTLRVLFILPWLLPLIVSGTIWKWLFNEANGLIDLVLSGLHLVPAHFSWLTTPGWAFASIIFVNIWLGIPFNMVILYSGLQTIPQEFYEAASIDGASSWQRFLYITIPMLEPVIGIVLMLGFIYTIKVFDIIYVLTQGGPANDTQTFATWSYNLSFGQQLFGQGAAQANMILLISLVVAVFYLRWSRYSTRSI